MNQQNLSIILKFILPSTLLLIGLYQSFLQAFQTWYPDPDIASFALISHDIIRNGWESIHGFCFLTDNLLLSLILPDTLIFYLLGDSPSIALGTGIAFFWISALISGCIVAQVSSISRGIWAATLVLLAPQSFLGVAGQLTYPATHNVSMLWGLVGLLFILIWIKKRQTLLFICAFIILTADAFSDPWALAVFIAPIIFTSGIFYAYPFVGNIVAHIQMRSSNVSIYKQIKPINLWASLFGFAISSAIICETHALGFLNLISYNKKAYSGFHIHGKSIIKLLEYLPYCFNFLIYPFRTPNYNSFNPAAFLHRHTFPTANIVIDDSILILILVGVIYNTHKQWKELSVEQKYLILFTSFSSLTIICAWCTVPHSFGFLETRWIINLFYSLILALCTLPLYNPSLLNRLVVSFLLCSWILSSLISNSPVWWKKIPTDNSPSELIKLIKLLEKEKIKEAYGDYWNTYANSIRWISHDTIYMVPTNYNGSYHGFISSFLASPHWYHQNSGHWAFVLSKKDICTPYKNCTNAVINQFGNPQEIKNTGEFSLLIYNGVSPKLPIVTDMTKAPTPLNIPQKTSGPNK